MSINPPLPIPAEVTRLQTFLKTLEEFLGELVALRGQIFPPDPEDRLKAAWEDIRERGVFDAARSGLLDLADQLDEAGLTGAQLDVKESLATYGIGQARHLVGDFVGGMRDVGIGKLAAVVASALGCADIIVGSLPPVPGKELLKEIKLVVEEGAGLVSSLV